MEKPEQFPFAELPEALVEEMLSKSQSLGDTLYANFKEIHENKEKIRKELQKKKILRTDAELGYPGIPTTSGIDGAYAVERLLATDFAVCAAVAIEGLIPPSEKRYWPKPHHIPFVSSVKHDPDTGTILRGIMITMESELAVKSPHDIVFLDGSLTTPLIFVNQAMNAISGSRDTIIAKTILNRLKDFIISYKTILESSRTDKLWVSLPKYTTHRELGKKFNWPSHYDDRAILTNILHAGEFTTPVLLEQPTQPWHLNVLSDDDKFKKLRDDMLSLIAQLRIMYYRPQSWTPALRIEMAPSIATNNSRIAVLLQGLKYQCGTPGIFEPYPLYMADRMVKHLGSVIPALKQTATIRMTELYKGDDVGEIFFNMHGYRTELGR